jgi:hypothetical protein
MDSDPTDHFFILWLVFASAKFYLYRHAIVLLHHLTYFSWIILCVGHFIVCCPLSPPQMLSVMHRTPLEHWRPACAQLVIQSVATLRAILSCVEDLVPSTASAPAATACDGGEDGMTPHSQRPSSSAPFLSSSFNSQKTDPSSLASSSSAAPSAAPASSFSALSSYLPAPLATTVSSWAAAAAAYVGTAAPTTTTTPTVTAAHEAPTLVPVDSTSLRDRGQAIAMSPADVPNIDAASASSSSSSTTSLSERASSAWSAVISALGSSFSSASSSSSASDIDDADFCMTHADAHAREETEVAKLLYELVRRDEMLQSLLSSLLAVGAVASAAAPLRDTDNDGDDGNGNTSQRYSQQQQQNQARRHQQQQQQQQHRQLVEFCVRCAAELRPITQLVAFLAARVMFHHHSSSSSSSISDAAMALANARQLSGNGSSGGAASTNSRRASVAATGTGKRPQSNGGGDDGAKAMEAAALALSAAAQRTPLTEERVCVDTIFFCRDRLAAFVPKFRV